VLKVTSSEKSNSQQSGIALILVIFIVALASTIVVNMAYLTTISSQQNNMVVQSLQAEYLLKSALNVARRLIQADTSPQDHPKDPWGMFLNGAQVPQEFIPLNEPNMSLELEIRPEDGRLRLDQLAGSSRSKIDQWGPVFLNLFTNLGFDSDDEKDHTGLFPDKVFSPREMVGVLIDYMDSDKQPFEETRYAKGIENRVDEGIFPNERIDDVDELKNLPGFTPKRLQKLTPFVTTRGGSYVNINTAPREILRALHVDMTEDVVDAIVSYRNQKAFGEDTADGEKVAWKNELRDLVGEQIFEEIRFMVNIESRWYQVIAKVDYGGNSRFFLRATVYESHGTNDELPRVSSLELF
jgi:general secretion pathway protein K